MLVLWHLRSVACPELPVNFYHTARCHHTHTLLFVFTTIKFRGHAVAQLVEALCYKREGHGSHGVNGIFH